MIKKIKENGNYLFYILTKEQKKYGIFVLFCSLIGAVLETLGVSIIAPMVTILLTPDDLMGNNYVQMAEQYLGIDEYTEIVFGIILGIVFLYIFKNLFFMFLSWVRAKYACKISREISVEMMSSYMKRGYLFFTKHNAGELLNGVTSDVGSVYVLVNSGLKIIVDVLTIVLICIFMLVKDTKLALIVMVLAGLCFLLILKVFRKAMLRSGDLYRKYNQRSHQALLHAFEGIKDVIILDKREFFVKEYDENYTNQQRENVGRTIAGESPAYIIEGVCVSGLMLAVGFTAINSNNPAALVATLASFAIGAFRVLPSLGRISNSMNTMLYSIKGMQCVYENLVEAREYTKEEDIPAIDTKRTEKIQFEQALDIHNLTFAYDSQAQNVIQELNMQIPKGSSVAFIGQSGAGKTTLADIILGLLPPKAGEITIDGKNIHQLGREWWNVIGYVPQSVYLSDNSVRSNVAFGVDEDQIDDEKVWNALEQAQLKEFVEGLPEGIHTFVGDRGIRFSGGQRQRMAIARALYFEPQILVLDEATSALDGETEQAVMQSIDALYGKITLIIVAHRLTTIRNCDRIYEIKNGTAMLKDKKELF